MEPYSYIPTKHKRQWDSGSGGLTERPDLCFRILTRPDPEGDRLHIDVFEIPFHLVWAEVSHHQL